MEHLTLLHPRECDAQLLALCAEHLTREETLLADLLLSLRQVRDAFLERNLGILPTLHDRQHQLTQTAGELATARESLRASLADLLGVSVSEATLRAAALSLKEPQRGHLLQWHTRLTAMIREAEQLSQQNAVLLGYARGFLASLFANLTGTIVSERYGPDGERRGVVYGSFLQARG